MSEQGISETNPIQLETSINAKFRTKMPPRTPEEQASLDALNTHTEEICERLQPVFRALIIDMLELKRNHFTKGGQSNAGSQQARVSQDG